MVLVTWKPLELTVGTAEMAIKSLFLLFSLLVLFVVLSMIVVMCSWFDYRKEEVELISEAVQQEVSQVHPKLASARGELLHLRCRVLKHEAERRALGCV